MVKNTWQFVNIFLRYFILILVAIPNLLVFYIIFTPLTIYSIYFLLGLFYDVALTNSVITISNSIEIEIIGACVAGAAYYLLFILNISTPKIAFTKRINLILLSFLAFFVANIIRIFLLSIVAISGFSWFDLAHKFFWYFLSTLFVVIIWFVEVKYFKIKELPLYSDLKFLYKNSSLKK